jgi:hypothetical protein
MRAVGSYCGGTVGCGQFWRIHHVIFFGNSTRLSIFFGVKLTLKLIHQLLACLFLLSGLATARRLRRIVAINKEASLAV